MPFGGFSSRSSQIVHSPFRQVVKALIRRITSRGGVSWATVLYDQVMVFTLSARLRDLARGQHIIQVSVAPLIAVHWSMVGRLVCCIDPALGGLWHDLWPIASGAAGDRVTMPDYLALRRLGGRILRCLCAWGLLLFAKGGIQSAVILGRLLEAAACVHRGRKFGFFGMGPAVLQVASARHRSSARTVQQY